MNNKKIPYYKSSEKLLNSISRLKDNFRNNLTSPTYSIALKEIGFYQYSDGFLYDNNLNLILKEEIDPYNIEVSYISAYTAEYLYPSVLHFIETKNGSWARSPVNQYRIDSVYLEITEYSASYVWYDYEEKNDLISFQATSLANLFADIIIQTTKAGYLKFDLIG